MDPTWMAMGQAAGVAAVLSVREGVIPRRVPVEKLQRELTRQKARLMFYWDVPLDHPGFGAFEPGRAVTWAELVGLLRLIQARPAADPAARVAQAARTSEFAAGLKPARISPQAPVSRAQACMLMTGLADF